jgi:hypothetical protein
MLVLSPAACVLSAVAVTETFETFMDLITRSQSPAAPGGRRARGRGGSFSAAA